MAEQSLRGWWVILLTLFLAMIFSVLSLPKLFPFEFGYLRPDWVPLVLIYWVIALPHRVGTFSAWCVGLLMDVLLGTLLGQHALVYMIVAYVAGNLYQRLRMFAVWQQSLVVFGLIGVTQLMGFWIESIVTPVEWSFWLLLPAVMSGFIWPWMFLLLRFARRFFGVN